MDKELFGCTSSENHIENFGDVNVEDILKRIENGKAKKVKSKIYTMVQINAPCEVDITEESRELCADILFRF